MRLFSPLVAGSSPDLAFFSALYSLVVGLAFLVLVTVCIGLLWVFWRLMVDSFHLGEIGLPWWWMIGVAAIFSVAGYWLAHWWGASVGPLVLLVFSFGKLHARTSGVGSG